jgi:cytochrome c-type biogenesis protein CcmH/NrfG
MNSWKGSATALAMHAVLLMGCPAQITEPDAAPATPAPAVATPDVRDLLELDIQLDELMTRLQQEPENVAVMEQVARIYVRQGWHEGAIGPLARALQLEPGRRGLWTALDAALKGSGIASITDAELEERAARFVEAIEMWGHGC